MVDMIKKWCRLLLDSIDYIHTTSITTKKKRSKYKTFCKNSWNITSQKTWAQSMQHQWTCSMLSLDSHKSWTNGIHKQRQCKQWNSFATQWKIQYMDVKKVLLVTRMWENEKD